MPTRSRIDHGLLSPARALHSAKNVCGQNAVHMHVRKDHEAANRWVALGNRIDALMRETIEELAR